MVLLVVDTQEMLVTEKMYRCKTFLERVKKLISTAREQGSEVIYVRHDDGIELTRGVPGFEISKEAAPMQGEKIFDKRVNSAFKGSGLLEYLREKQENSVMIVGLQTDYCIDATVKCGFEHGFEMIVPAGCNTTEDNSFLTAEKTYRYYNEMMWNRRYARCVELGEAVKLLESGRQEH